MRARQQTIRQIHQIGSDTSEQIVPYDTCPRQTSVGMRGVGLSDVGRNYEMGRQRPDFIHILLCTGGQGKIWQDDDWIECRRGQALITGQSAAHAFASDRRSRWQLAWLYYSVKSAAALGLHEGEVRLLQIDPDPLRLTIEGFWRESVGLRQIDVLDRWADLIHLHVLRLCDPRHPPDPLWALWEQVRAHPAEPWDLLLLAEQAGMGDEHLRRLCQKHYGRSPMKHLTHLRMQQAGTMLLSSPDKIAAIAARVGYANEFAFSTAFRKWSGVSPGVYRRA